MVRLLSALVAVFSLLVTLSVQARNVSPEARLSVLTCTPGTEIYSVYGHTAIRFRDPRSGLDLVYNYGVFDSFEENFALKFAQGQLDYELGLEDYRDFHRMYAYFGRGITEQELNLDTPTVQAIVDFLDENYLPENRKYRYHFFFDNCSSRVLDVLRDQLGDRLQLPEQGAPTMQRGQTFRDLIHAYQKPIPWTDLGIDLVLGMPCDRVVEVHQESFLPDYLMDELSVSSLDGKPLVAQTRELLADRQPPLNPKVSPGLVVSLICVGLMLLLVLLTRLNRVGLLRATVLGFFGILGLLLLLMWVATDHDTTVKNFNVLMAPAILVLLPIPALRTWITRFCIALVGLFVAGWVFWPQDLPPASLAMAMLVLAALTQPLWKARVLPR